jgi:AcrR family transcriptional regulator
MQSLELVAEGTPPGMRAVANRLGVKAPSLYRHISGRDALVNYVRDRMASDANLAAPTGDWRSEIRRVVSTQRESFVKHSALVPQLVATPISTGVVLNIYGRSA